MAKGNSGRIVIEVDPEFKQDLYKVLGSQGLNLKEWFVQSASDFLNEHNNPTLPLFSNDHKKPER